MNRVYYAILIFFIVVPLIGFCGETQFVKPLSNERKNEIIKFNKGSIIILLQLKDKHGKNEIIFNIPSSAGKNNGQIYFRKFFIDYDVAVISTKAGNKEIKGLITIYSGETKVKGNFKLLPSEEKIYMIFEGGIGEINIKGFLIYNK